MYWIAVIIMGVYLILLLLSRKEGTDEKISFILKPFYRIAMYLYKRICYRLPGLFSVAQVEKDLQQLYPGEAGECLKTDYYVKKGAMSLAIFLAGTLLAAAVKYSASMNRILDEEGAVVRGSYRDGAKNIDLMADYRENQFSFQLQIDPVLLSGEEMEALFEEFLEQLPEYIAGENPSLEEVTSDLELEESYGVYPVYVEWESSRPELIGDTGYVAEVEELETVTLFAHMTYGKYQRTEEITVTLIPPVMSEEELLYMEMQEMLLQAQSDSAEQEVWILPSQWQGERVSWTQLIEDNSFFLWGAAIAAAVTAFLLSDKDLHKQLEKRRERMRSEYPDIVHKLVLYVGAGMTIRGAFQKIAGDYEIKHQNGGRDSPAHEEMVYTCRELRSGVSEGASYEHFGRRTGLQEYIRLSTLLMQNLKRGNSMLLDRLREEADKASQEQLQQGKKLGEEAGTKLLVPMVLMLAVVMAVIMIPALSNM